MSLKIPQLIKLRIIIYLVLSLSCFFVGISFASLILFSLLIGILSVTILSSYEAKNTQFVLENKIEKSFAARAMQTVIQTGAFIGAMCGSLILNQFGFEFTVYAISIFDILVCLILLWFELKAIKTDEIQLENKFSRKLPFSVYLLSILLGLVGLHISTFNLTVPILFQRINQWQVTDFGLASGFSGLGAFLAVFCKIPNYYFRLLIILFILADILFMFNQSKWFIIPLCLIIGFCMNTIRIILREKLIEQAKNPQQAVDISGISAYFYMFIQSAGTLILGGLLGVLPNVYLLQLLLPLIAIILGICFLSFFPKKS